MLLKSTTVLLLLALTFTTSFCQGFVADTNYASGDIFSRLQDDSYGGDIDFYQNPSLHVLIDKNARLNLKNGIDGFRIQIYSGIGGSARDEMNNVKKIFKQTYPELNNNPIYFDYQAPYYMVKIGDYRNKNEAFYVFQQIKEEFPSSYIVKTKINFPELHLSENE